MGGVKGLLCKRSVLWKSAARLERAGGVNRELICVEKRKSEIEITGMSLCLIGL